MHESFQTKSKVKSKLFKQFWNQLRLQFIVVIVTNTTKCKVGQQDLFSLFYNPRNTTDWIHFFKTFKTGLSWVLHIRNVKV